MAKGLTVSEWLVRALRASELIAVVELSSQLVVRRRAGERRIDVPIGSGAKNRSWRGSLS
jgi:hypothetical protein